jgi:hypothetical protein
MIALVAAAALDPANVPLGPTPTEEPHAAMSHDYQSLIERYEQGGESWPCRSAASRGRTCSAPRPGRQRRPLVDPAGRHPHDGQRTGLDRPAQAHDRRGQPTLLGYDENKYVQHLSYDEQSAEDAASIVAIARRMFAKVLHKLPAAAFERTGTHNERGRASTVGLVPQALCRAPPTTREVHGLDSARVAPGKEMW